MGRGRIEIKKIENPTNRQVTYSKRRVGIMKKANELTVLCDAEVSVVMFSNTGKFAEYCSPSTNTKSIMDRYQQVTGIDLWKDQYESTLRSLKESNHNLRKEIRQRMGEDLDELGVEELRGLEQSLDETLVHVRQRKYHVITTQTDTYKKKLKNTHETHQSLLHQLEMKDQHQGYRFVAERALSTANDATQMFAYQVHSSQQNLLELGYGSRDLSIA
ncbi:MADS-box transcription factor 16-like isoform X2 [Asparagus officinalis]|uniref:MADS-box transcription factor 16-like isoform X2 n=1 Tax=Asparagus officinalis TaxID=4686 RepID=UPI00098E3C5E|nr:MADS-box transcription factor 16-like isoform X2 [Asparagus officinalis]